MNRDGKIMVLGLMAALSFVSGLAGAETVKTLDREVFVREPNYDETKIAPYTLEDPLKFLDGRKVTKVNWPERRKEILGIFAREMCGEGLPAGEWPDAYDTSAIGACLGYVRRSENHGISAYDWMWMMDFSDRVFGR